MQKRANNFFNKNEKNNNVKSQNTEENDYGNNKHDKYQLTEAKTYKKTKINSPYISEKRNFLINSDFKLSNKQFIYESGKKLTNNAYFFKNDLNNKKINAKNSRNTYIKYNTEYNNENDELYYEIQSKIYKKVIEQFNNNLNKYCKKILSDEYSKFLNNFKIIALQNKPKPKVKTYKKKNIINKNIYKNKKSPDKFNQDKKNLGNMISPFINYKNVPKKNNKIINHKASINNSQKKVIYSNYFNLNIFENNTNNKYIYSSKTTKPKIKDEFKSCDKNSISQKNLSMNTSIDLNHKNEIINNEINNYGDKKNAFKTCLKRNPDKKLTQPKNNANIYFIGKDNLKTDNKNSLVFINYSTKKKIIDKLQNIKLFRQTNSNDKNNKEDNLEQKKENFDKLIKRLKNVAFFQHFEKFFEFLNNKNKKEFFEILKQKPLSNEENLQKKNENNINEENNNNITNHVENENILENKNENKLDEEHQSNKIDKIVIKDEENKDKDNNINNIKNLEINYENIEKKENEQENLNNIKCINVKDVEILDEKIENNKNIILDNNLNINPEINLNEQIDDSNIFNEEGKKEINFKEDDINDINIDNLQPEKNNEKEKEINEQNFDNLNNSLNNQINEEEQPKIDLENKEEIKDNTNRRNILLEKIFKNKTFKEKINIMRKNFIKWKQNINEEIYFEKNDENEKEKDNINIIEENLGEDITEKKEENKEGKRNIINIKTLFLDEIDEEEKEVILEEMIFRFRTLLISSCFINKENFSDSFE